MLLNFVLIVILLIIVYFIIYLKHKNKNEYYVGYYEKNNVDALKECQVPTLNTEQCYKSRYYECPIVNGSYVQCTNNYIPEPNYYNADCGNRTFDMVPYPWKISENCYYNKIGYNHS
jgi:hypothetical protein